jgi:hypothetical protein
MLPSFFAHSRGSKMPFANVKLCLLIGSTLQFAFLVQTTTARIFSRKIRCPGAKRDNFWNKQETFVRKGRTKILCVINSNSSLKTLQNVIDTGPLIVILPPLLYLLFYIVFWLSLRDRSVNGCSVQPKPLVGGVGSGLGVVLVLKSDPPVSSSASFIKSFFCRKAK